MLLVVSFLVNPERSVTAPDGTQWHVAVVRGNKWPGVDWGRHPAFAWNPFGRAPLNAALIESYLLDAVLWCVDGLPTTWVSMTQARRFHCSPGTQAELASLGRR